MNINLIRFKPLLSDASETIINENVSFYPIMVFSKTPVEIGIALYEPISEEEEYFIFASTLEELTVKNLIREERVKDFSKLYKEHDQHLCLLFLDLEDGKFAFVSKD